MMTNRNSRNGSPCLDDRRVQEHDHDGLSLPPLALGNDDGEGPIPVSRRSW